MHDMVVWIYAGIILGTGISISLAIRRAGYQIADAIHRERLQSAMETMALHDRYDDTGEV